MAKVHLGNKQFAFYVGGTMGKEDKTWWYIPSCSKSPMYHENTELDAKKVTCKKCKLLMEKQKCG